MAFIVGDPASWDEYLDQIDDREWASIEAQEALEEAENGTGDE